MIFNAIGLNRAISAPYVTKGSRTHTVQIYCFDIDGNPEWPTGTAIAARDRRTATSVLLYRSLDPGREQDQQQGHHRPAPRQMQAALEQRRRARAVLNTLPAARSSDVPSLHPLVELFTCEGFLALATPDAAAAAPALEKLRAEGLFRVAQPPPPPPPPPSAPVICSRCSQAKSINSNGLCATCATPKTSPPEKASAASRRSRAWIALPLLIALIAIALYLWQPKPEPKAAAPIVQFAASPQSVKKGSRVLLSWSTSNLSNLSISPGIGEVPAAGKRWVVMSHDTTFSLYGTGTGYTSPVTVTVSVTEPTVKSPPRRFPDPGDSTKPQTAPSNSAAPPATPPRDQPRPQYLPAPQYQPNQDSAARYQISAVLDHWAAAYRANDARLQAALYAPQVERFFLHQNVDKDYVQSYMTTFYARGSHFTSFSFTTPEITFTSEDNANVNFVKSYTLRIATGEVRNVTSRSEIRLVRISGRWLITFERDYKG